MTNTEWSTKDKEYIKNKIRDIQDFPQPGILFRDITTLLKDSQAFEFLISKLYMRYKEYNIDCIAGIEARGFILGAALAAKLQKGFIPIRKKGKLPATTISEKYALEYGFSEVEIHLDAFESKKNSKVLLIDDLIATGGTAEASIHLIQSAQGECVEACFLLNLKNFTGLDKIKQLTPVFTVLDIE